MGISFFSKENFFIHFNKTVQLYPTSHQNNVILLFHFTIPQNIHDIIAILWYYTTFSSYADFNFFYLLSRCYSLYILYILEIFWATNWSNEKSRKSIISRQLLTFFTFIINIIAIMCNYKVIYYLIYKLKQESIEFFLQYFYFSFLLFLEWNHRRRIVRNTWIEIMESRVISLSWPNSSESQPIFCTNSEYST